MPVNPVVSAGGAADLTATDAAIAVVDQNVDDIETLSNTIDGKVDTIDGVVGSNNASLLTVVEPTVAAIQTDLGNPSARTNFQTLEAILGLPDAASSSLDDMVRTGFDSSGISADLDGSILEVLNYIIENMDGSRTLTSTIGSETENWGTQTGTSSETGEDLVTIGANNTDYMLHSLLLDVSACTNGAVISVKLFMQVNGVEQKVYDQDFTVDTDTDGLWIVNGSVAIHEALRVEVESDTDESVAIAYDYSLESMI